MPDVENVIKGLECIISSGNAGMRDDCANCIYPGGGDCLAPALQDVLALLKAQEPRLVTIDDFKGADEYGWLPAWCEEYAGAIYCECILVDALKEKGIRYWTSRPDEKRRVETPWE